MLKFKKTERGASISLDDKVIYRFNRDAYLCSFGKGHNDYSMSHGSFVIREHIYFKNDYRVEEVEVSDDKITVKSSNAVIEVFRVGNNRIKVVPTIDDDCNRFWITLPAGSSEFVYGSGETFTEFNLRGKKVNVWVAEHINGLQTAKKIVKQVFGIKNSQRKQSFDKYETYYAEPTFISSKKYYYHSDTTARAEFDFTSINKHIIKVDDISPFYMGFGTCFEEVMEDLTDLTGRQPELPDWVYDGAILGVQGGTEIMMHKVDTAINAGTDVCGVWIQDWEGRRVTAVGKQLQWNWVWDQELYPNLDEKIKELNEKGIKVLGYINPFLALEKPLYKEASKKGYCVKDKEGKDYLVKITTFPAAMVDFTNPEACEWIKDIIKKNMIDLGLSGWMADFGEYLPTDCVLYSKENPELIHNTWPARWAQLNREAVEEAGKLGEIMFFTRSGYTDTKKYSTMMWNGDNHVDYSIDFGLPSVIPAALSLTCCGFGLSHSDIGGYTTFMNLKRSDELFMRWCEMNAFTPVLRGHEGLNPDVNAQFDFSSQTLEHHAKFSRIHKNLKPYIKDCVKENAEKGIGVIRPIFFHYDEDRAYKESYEFMLGRDILVAPVVRDNSQNRVLYLPNDEWVHIWSGKEYKGGKHTVYSPVGQPPVFVRKSSEKFDELMNIVK